MISLEALNVKDSFKAIHRVFRCPLFRGLYRFIRPYVALVCNIFIYIRLNKDIQAYNEGAPNRGPLDIPMSNVATQVLGVYGGVGCV